METPSKMKEMAKSLREWNQKRTANNKVDKMFDGQAKYNERKSEFEKVR